MIKINKYIKQQGNATSICLIAMAFFLILIAGTIFYNNSSVRASATARDHYQAQYWAEAGIKRAIDGFKTQSNTWTWVDTTGNPANWQSGSNNTHERYHISIYDRTAYNNFLNNNATKPNPITPPNPTNRTAGDYTIVATGSVNNIIHTMTADVSIRYPPNLKYNNSMFRYGAFAGESITFNPGNYVVTSEFSDINKNKQMDAGDYIQLSDGSYVYGSTGLGATNIYCNSSTVNFDSKSSFEYNSTGTYSSTTGDWVQFDNTNWGLGTFDSLYNNTASQLSSNSTIQINNVNDFKMALIQNAQKESNNYIFKNTTLYFSQTFNFSDLSMNSTITFDNSALFINGGLSLSDKNQIIQFSNNCIVASNGDMQLKNQKNLNGAYISFSNITFDNSTLNSGSLYAQEKISFGQQLGATDCTINLVPQTSNNIFYKQISSNSGVTVTTNNWCFDI